MELKVFRNSEFGQLGVLIIDGREFFPATDCATKLGYSNPRDAISRHCRWVVKREVPHPQNPAKLIKINFIPEGDLYRLIVKSHLPSAERFERWVFDEVLPTIRRHGMYATPQAVEAMLSDPDTMIRTLQVLKEEREKRKALEEQAERDKPKVIFADAVAASKTAILIGELAKLLKQNGVPSMGQNRLFAWLRDNGYLIRRKGTDYNMPTQYSMELGLFEVKETAVTHSDGHISVSKTPKVTGKGQAYFINKFLADQIIEGGKCHV